MSAKRKTSVKDGDNLFIKRLAEVPERGQRLFVILAALNLPEKERDQVIAVFAETIRNSASAIVGEASKYASDLSLIADYLQERQSERGEASEAEKRLLECCDEGLAFLMRDSHGLDRASRSESRELTCTASAFMHETSSLLGALRRDLELSEDDNERRDTLRYFADHVHGQAEGLSDLIDKYPEAAKGIGADYPNWPFVMFRRDNLPVDQRRQADLIGLGDTCAVNPSPRVNWTLLQKYLFTILWEWQDVKRFLDYKPNGRTEVERVKLCLARYPLRPEQSISDREAQLFLESLKLPPFGKARESRRAWAESFLIPLIDLREADLEAVPAFSVWLEGANMKVRDHKGMLAAIKEGVIRALDAMVRDGQG